MKIYYPKHAQAQGKDILSGAVISDLGDKLVYRYNFKDSDYSALSGFPGRKIYDTFESNFDQSDEFGNYILASGQHATYKFNTLYSVKKITIRNVKYNQSMAIHFSADGENWKEIFFDDPGEDNQSAGPLIIYPESETENFYLKMEPAGDFGVISELDLEAELDKTAS